MTPLTPRQHMFVSAYLAEPNATKAAIAAGYSEKAARVTGPRLLKMEHIQSALGAAQAVRSVRAQVKAEDVVQELARAAFVDITDFLTEEGRLRPISEWPQQAGRMVAKVKTRTVMEGKGDDAVPVEVTEIQLWDKISALDKLAKHFGLLVERQEVTVEHRFAKMRGEELDAFIENALKTGAISPWKAVN